MEKQGLNFISNSNQGLYCKSGNIWIDPIKPVKNALISHAHFDHVSLGCSQYICSHETKFLLYERLGKNINIKSYDYEENFKINGINISFHPSGHIFGSSQIKFEAGGEKWLITGDFKRQKDSTCKAYSKLKADILICESTFALPIFNWECSSKIVNDIYKWIIESEDKTCILFCYSLGKAQRILNEIKDKNLKEIYTHKNIYKINHIYRKLGVNLPETISLDLDKNIENLKGKLLLLPPSLNNKNFLKKFKNIQTGFASGWMSIRAQKKRGGYDKGFAISDHADWNGLIKTVKDSKAKIIIFNHGDSSSIEKYLKTVENSNIGSLKNMQ